MKDLDWLKVLILSIAIVIAGIFVGNMHKIGKKYDRDENTPQIKIVRVVSTIDFQLEE